MSAGAYSTALPRTPLCVIVTGPSASEKTRWLQQALRQALAARPATRCAVLASDETAEEMLRFARTEPRLLVSRLSPLCICCPGRTDLPRALRMLVDESAAEVLFLELPTLVAAAQLAELAALEFWPREVVVCLDAAWTAARRADALSFFQFLLLAAADHVIEPSEAGGPDARAVFRGSPRRHPAGHRRVRRVLTPPCRP